MEYFDVIGEDGLPTGQIVSRKEAHEKGIKHQTSHIWIVNDRKVLLQRRSATKDSFPLCLDTSSAGHIQAGDEPLESALRELEEELGIHASATDLTYIGDFIIDYQKEFHGKLFIDNEIAHTYVYEKKVDISQLSLQEEEVCEVIFEDIDDVMKKMYPRDEAYCVPVEGIELVYDYLQKKRLSITA